MEEEARKTLGQFLEYQKSYHKKNMRYAIDMYELIGSLKRKPVKPIETIQNSRFIIAFSPLCILSSPSAKKAKKLLLWYPELPDEKQAAVKLTKMLASNFEFLIKKKIKDLPKGKCPSASEGFELYGIGLKEDGKSIAIWSINQEAKVKKIH